MKYKNPHKNTYAKALYAVIVLAFVFVSFSFLLSVKTKEVFWSNFADTNYQTELVTDENGEKLLHKYISTPEQLAGIFVSNSSAVYATSHEDGFSFINSKYILTQDIDCSSYTWSGVNLNSGITLDGNNYTIKGLKFSTSQAIQGFVQTNYGTIQNLFFDCVTFTTNGSVSTFGIIAGENKGTIKNCTIVSGDITHSKAGVVGGIAGTNNNYGTIAKCINYANITVLEWCGGIVGRNYSGTVSNCFNYGKISSAGNSTLPRIGGIVGELSQWGTLKNCYNEGIILGGCAVGATVYAGGIVGLSEANISSCGNKGSIMGGYANCGESFAGGIVGGDYNQSITISDCYNTGWIIAQSKPITTNPTDGYTNISNTEIHDHKYFYWFTTCRDEMFYKRTTTATRIESKAHAGGIAGKCSYKIENCYNIGDVEGGSKYTKYVIKEEYQTTLHCNAIANKDSPAKASCSYTVQMYDALYSAPICSNTKTVNNCYYSSEANHNYNKQNSYNYNNGNAQVPSSRSGSWLFMNYVDSSSSLDFSYDITNKMVGYWEGITNSSPYVTQSFYIENGYLIYKATPKDCWNMGDNVKKVKNSYGLNIKLNPNTPIQGTANTNANIKTLSLGTNWKVSENINDGYPYLVNLYWE